MISLQQVLSKCPHQVPDCHIQRAMELHQQLTEGASFNRLGGKRIKQSPHIIRFKIGRGWRLLYLEQGPRLVPYCLIARQRFEQTIKRR